MSKGREFQIVGAATEKLLEPKHVHAIAKTRQLKKDFNLYKCNRTTIREIESNVFFVKAC